MEAVSGDKLISLNNCEFWHWVRNLLRMIYYVTRGLAVSEGVDVRGGRRGGNFISQCTRGLMGPFITEGHQP